MAIRAGTLRHRITFQARSTSQDRVGGQVQTWTDVVSHVAACLEPSFGRELLTAQAMNIDQPVTITVRWQPALADTKAVAAMRIVFGTRLFNIHSCQNVEERNRTLVLIASVGLNEG